MLPEDPTHDASLPWWEWHVARNEVRSSPRKVTMLGYAAEDFVDAGYQAFTELLHPEDLERSMQAMRDYLEGRAELYQVDYRIRRRAGDYVWYVDRGSAVDRDENGRVAVLRGVVFNLGAELPEQADEALFRALREALEIPTVDTVTKSYPTQCMQCRRLRKAPGQWSDLGEKVGGLITRPVSHGLCWPCAHDLYPEVAEHLRRKRPDLF